MPCADTVPATFGKPGPFGHGVVTACQRYVPPDDGAVSTLFRLICAWISFAPNGRATRGHRDVRATAGRPCITYDANRGERPGSRVDHHRHAQLLARRPGATSTQYRGVHRGGGRGALCRPMHRPSPVGHDDRAGERQHRAGDRLADQHLRGDRAELRPGRLPERRRVSRRDVERRLERARRRPAEQSGGIEVADDPAVGGCLSDRERRCERREGGAGEDERHKARRAELAACGTFVSSHSFFSSSPSEGCD